jgi:hypothetical protein
VRGVHSIVYVVRRKTELTDGMTEQSTMTNKRISIALLLFGVTVLFRGQAQSQDPEPAPSKDRPLLEINLNKFGYNTSRSPTPSQRFVDFTDSSHLGLAWETFDDPTSGTKMGIFPPKPAHLHVLVLDATTGSNQGSREWPTQSTPIGFSGFSDGKILTCTGNVLHLFSPTFQVIHEQELASDRACLNRKVSPSRRTFFLSVYSEKSYQNTLLNFDTFATTATWTDQRATKDVSDHWLIGYCDQSRMVCIRGTDQTWQPFRPDGLDEQMTNPMRATTQFVNDTTLLIEAWNRMAVATVDGRLLFERSLPKNQ